MKRYYSILLTLFITIAAYAADISFKATAPSAVVVGQQFRIEYKVNGDGKEFRAGDFSGLDVLMGPSTSSSFSTSYVNGKSTSETTKTYSYVVIARAEGTATASAASIKVDGRQYTSNSLSIKVLPQDKASEAQSANSSSSQTSQAAGMGSKDILCRMILSKTKVYEGEPILATIKYYTVNPNTKITDIKLPTFEGFVVQELDEIKNQSYDMENYDGRNYYTAIIKEYILFPQRGGKLEIPSTTMEVSVPVRTQKQMRSIFDDFFDNYQQVEKNVSSSKQTVNVEPLPLGKPSSFYGGIGDFKISSNVSTTELKANDALTLKLTISGTGNLRYIKDPELKLPADFEVFDPKVDLNIKTSKSGVSGSKTIEYTIIPRYAGNYTISSVEFSYFDLKSKSYKTLSTQSFDLTVEKSAASDSSNPGIANFSNATKEQVKMLGSDIRFIKTGDYNLKKDFSFIFGTTLYWLLYIIPLVLAIISFIIYRKQIKENANISLMKNKNANKVALKRLKLAGKYLKDKKTTEFYEEMLKAIWGYLSDKLNIPTSELTKENIEEKLSVKGVDKDLISNFIKIIEDCEFARYAPSQVSDSMDKTYDETVAAIGKMESAIRK